MPPSPLHSDVLVLGAGAAGLFCAAQAGARGYRVRVLESANKPGKKILMSGGGRCNFTNREAGPEHFLSANAHFCKSALARYTPADFLALVESHGVGWHEKERGQLFCNESSKDILTLLLRDCESAGVMLHTATPADAVQAHGTRWQVHTAQGVFQAEKLVVATGGLSIPSLGGSGFGYALARQLGHTLLPTRAGLVPLTLSGQPLTDWCDLSGLALPVTASAQGAHFSHQLLITHRGLSGPAMLQISNYWQAGEALRLDVFPHTAALPWLLEKRRERPDAELKTVLAEVLPKRFAQRFVELLGANQPLKRLHDPALKALAAALHDWPVKPNGTEGYRTAEVTLGGVDTREVSSATMESKRAPGVYFIGEVLDVTGWLGGYNFQWAWASAAACAAAL